MIDGRAPFLRAVAAPAAAGLAVRLLFIAWTSPLSLSLDETRFWGMATSGMAGTAFLPPLVPGFLILVRVAFGDSVIAARIVLACLSAMSIVLVFVLAERHLRAGRSAAWIAAFTPALVYYDGRLRSEPLLILLLLGFTVLWTRPAGRGSWIALGAGMVLGAAALARPEFLVLTPVLFFFAGLSSKAGRASACEWGLLAVGIALLILPWSVRNHREMGAWVLVSDNGGYNFWKSFNPVTDGSQEVALDDGVWRDVAERDIDVFGYAEGLRFIRRRPLRSLALAPLKIAHLLGPERDFLSDLKRSAFPARLRVLDLGFAVAQNVAWILLLAGGLLALAGPRHTSVKVAALGLVGALVLVHLVFFGDDRFHVPMIPFLCVVLPEVWRERLWQGPRRILMVVAALLPEGVFWAVLLRRSMSGIGALLRGL
jgi:hypothetical protein